MQRHLNAGITFAQQFAGIVLNHGKYLLCPFGIRMHRFAANYKGNSRLTKDLFDLLGKPLSENLHQGRALGLLVP